MKIKDVNIGMYLQSLIEEKGISKGQFADAIGIRRQNVNRDIFDKESLDTAMVCRISEYLDFNLFSLFIQDNQYDYSTKEVKARIIIEMGAEKQEKSATFIFGENKVELK